jgi:hypothetical protein
VDKRLVPGYHSGMKRLLLPVVAAALCACAAKPVLYPNNPKYQQAGKEGARADVADCRKQADDYVKNDRAGRAAAQTAEGAAVGAAAGAAAGSVFGSLGRGALSGGIGGAAAGLVGAAFHTRQPNPVYKNFVDRCLHDRGYDILGWK